MQSNIIFLSALIRYCSFYEELLSKLFIARVQWISNGIIPDIVFASSFPNCIPYWYHTINQSIKGLSRCALTQLENIITVVEIDWLVVWLTNKPHCVLGLRVRDTYNLCCLGGSCLTSTNQQFCYFTTNETEIFTSLTPQATAGTKLHAWK